MSGYNELYIEGVNSFLSDLQNVFPNHPTINRILMNKGDFNYVKHLDFFHKKMDSKKQFLENRDEGMFKSSFVFIPMVDLMPLWAELNDTNKSAVWKHLQSLYIIADKIKSKRPSKSSSVPSMNSSNSSNSSDQNRILKNMIDQMQKDPSNMGKANKKIRSLLNEKKNPLVKLANDISNDLLKQKRNSNMSEEDYIKSLMNPGKNGGMRQLMSSIQSKFDEKVKSGEVDMSSMEESAKKMVSQLEHVLPKGFSDILKSKK